MSGWNAAGYQAQCDFVWRHGESLVTQLAPQAGEKILDLGCGTGQLTAQIAESGAIAIGMDSDRAMVEQAKANYPQLTFQVGDAADFQLKDFTDQDCIDAVFSNATLHWVTESRASAQCIANALRPDGRFVVEFGGKGNVQTILSALARVSGRDDLNPWYFPSLGEYVALLESVGLEVVFAQIFDRPTPLGQTGLAGWLGMFGQRFFADLSPTEWAELVKAVEAEVPQLYRVSENGGGEWIADYRRLRVIALKR